MKKITANIINNWISIFYFVLQFRYKSPNCNRLKELSAIILFFVLTIGNQLFAQKTISIFNAKGKVKITLQADLIKQNAGDYLVVYAEGKHGIYNYKTQKMTTEISYRDISISENGVAIAKDKHEKWGIISIEKEVNDKIILPFDYFEILQLSNRYYSVIKFDRTSGIFDIIENRFLIDCQYDTRIGLQDEVFLIRDNGLYALFGKNGKIVLPFQKQTFKTDSENHLINIRRNNKTLLFNTQTLEYQSELEFEEFPISFVNNFAKISKKDKYGFLHISGKMITNFEYHNVHDFNEFGFANVAKNEKWGVIDSTGKVVIPINFTAENCPKVSHNGLYISEKEGRFGIKRLDENWFISPDYQSIDFHKKYIIAYKKDASFYLFAYNGNLLHEMPPNQTIEPVGKLYRLSENGNYGWANHQLKTKGSIGLGYLYDFENERVTLVQKNKSMFGVVNSNGKIVIPVQFPFINIKQANHKIIFVQTNNVLWGAYNLKGKQIIEAKYNDRLILNDGWSVMW